MSKRILFFVWMLLPIAHISIFGCNSSNSVTSTLTISSILVSQVTEQPSQLYSSFLNSLTMMTA
jgi:ABC-type spermidine/putrescine transport system permease subunit II